MVGLRSGGTSLLFPSVGGCVSPPLSSRPEQPNFTLPISLPVRWLGCAVEGPLLSSPSAKGAPGSVWKPGSWGCPFHLRSRADRAREMGKTARINAKKKKNLRHRRHPRLRVFLHAHPLPLPFLVSHIPFYCLTIL